MAKIQRQTQKIFAGNANADQIAVFGSMKTGTPQYSTNLNVLQSEDYIEGWSEAIMNDKAPYLEEMNGVQYGLSYQVAYILQEGIPEYDAGTNYSNTAIVKSVDANNDIVLYHSLKAENVGNPLTDTESWARVYITNVGYIGQPQLTLDFGANALPENCIWLEGQELSRTLYSKLFAVYGTTYGEGDGSTTFNVPDLRNRVLWGSSTAGYLTAGLPEISGFTAGFPYKASNCWSRYPDKNGANGPTGAFYPAGYARVGSNDGRESISVAFAASRSNSIYGNSATVQPPAVKCRIFTRYQ